MNIFIITTGIMLSQNQFARAYGGDSTDWAHSVIQTASGDFVISGWTESFGLDTFHFLILKLTPIGDVIWVRRFSGVDTLIDWACSIVQTIDGGYAVAGWTGLSEPGFGEFVVMKLSSDGNTQWTRSIGGAWHDAAWSIVQTTDKGYAVAGLSRSLYPSDTPPDIMLVKLDSLGGLEWAGTFGGPRYDRAESLIRTSDGGFAIAGMTNSFGAGGFDFIVLRLLSTGAERWIKTFGGTGDDEALSITQTSDGGFAVAGYTNSYGAGSYDFLVLKIDSLGVLSWARTYGGLDDDRAQSIARTTDGGFVVAGWTKSFGASGWDFLVFKIASNGTLSWARRFGGAYDDRAECVIQSTDGGIVVTGGYSRNYNNEDILLLKLDANGNIPNCPQLQQCSPSITPVIPNTSLLTGPVQCSLHIQSASPVEDIPTLTITDICPSLSINEFKPSGSGITCSSIPQGALFVSPEPMGLKIYTGDGRLVYSGELRKGKNIIILNRGVYIWRAERFKGRIVVR